MVKEHEFYHGAALARIVSAASGGISIRPYESSTNSSFVLNDRIGIYIKYSSKRMSPWRFTFLQSHQDEIAEMRSKFDEVFVLLVCESDGIAAISFDELKRILDEHHRDTEWISATRRKREMYRIKGSDGCLEFKIGHSDFPHKILNSLNPLAQAK